MFVREVSNMAKRFLDVAHNLSMLIKAAVTLINAACSFLDAVTMFKNKARQAMS